MIPNNVLCEFSKFKKPSSKSQQNNSYFYYKRKKPHASMSNTKYTPFSQKERESEREVP